MIMRIVQQTEDYLCEFRTQLAYDIEEYETGRRTTGVLRNGSRDDDTQERIAGLKRLLARTDKLIATHQEYKNT
jgi:hypothetical protein